MDAGGSVEGLPGDDPGFSSFWGGPGVLAGAFPPLPAPPWSLAFFREAHNDYLELLAETGLIGFSLLALFFWQAGRRLYQGLGTVHPKVVPVFVALVAALGMMAFHEFFDFNLQIPANAFLFTLFLGMALRLAGWGVGSGSQPLALSPQPRVPIAVGMGVVAFILLILALKQESLPYPYNIREPTSLAEAREILLSHPARSSSHLSLFHLLKDRAAPSELLKELEIALWLDPRNPYARDLYAAGLVQQGREEEGLKEVTRSVAFAPTPSAHWYLGRRWMPWLSAKEQRAVEEGFKQALAFGYEGAVSGCAGPVSPQRRPGLCPGRGWREGGGTFPSGSYGRSAGSKSLSVPGHPNLCPQGRCGFGQSRDF